MKTCTQCQVEKPDSEFYKADRTGRLRANCKACAKAVVKQSVQKHGRKISPEAKAGQKRRHYLRHKADYVAAATARKSHVLRATPPWADMDAIKFFYECRPAGCEVDHIIPLRGETVSGLHVETNLQWLPASVNRRKSNHVQSTTSPQAQRAG